MLRNGLQLPKSSFPCLVAPGYTDSFARRVSRTTNISPRFYESTLCRSHAAQRNMTSAQGSTVQMLSSILRNEGIAGLYTGLRPTLLMTVPNTAITLTLYDEMMHKVQSQSADAPVYATLLVGAFSRCTASTVTLPLELIRTRQASYIASHGGMVGQTPGLVEDFRYLVKSNGIAALYKGLTVTLLRDSSFSGIYFVCLERFRVELKEIDGIGGTNHYILEGIPTPKSVTIAHNLLSGACAATVATLMTGPLDTAKTRKQMISKEASNLYKSLNIFGLIHVIYKHEGIAGLWKGNKARCTKVVPASAIMIACYELGKDVIREFSK